MDASDIAPLKKRKQKSGKRGAMNRSRSFVAEMFHSNTNDRKLSSQRQQAWSNTDLQLLQKMGLSPNTNQKMEKLTISNNLHPDLKQHAFEEQLNSLSTELSQTKSNLMKAAEYGQHLIEENSQLDAVVLELRNEAAEYIQELIELREENQCISIKAQSNECNVDDYQRKMTEFESERDSLNDTIKSLSNDLSDLQIKYSMECNVEEMEELQTKMMLLQNKNHSLLMQMDKIQKKYEDSRHKNELLEQQYNDVMNQLKAQDNISNSGDSQIRSIQISRRQKKEDANDRCNQLMIECVHLFEYILDNAYVQKCDDNNLDIERLDDLIKRVSVKLKLDLAANPIAESLDDYILQNAKDSDVESEDEERKQIENQREYNADNEDLDELPNKEMLIEPINDKKKECVEQFLVKYSDAYSWNKQDDKCKEYELEIPFYESVSLQNKKKNNIAISQTMLHSMTNFIETIMGICSEQNGNASTYISLCGWFCGRSEIDEFDHPSAHFSNILSCLDYHSKHREEMYWVIYQLLNVVYKYHHAMKQNDDDEDISDSESVSMVLTQSKSKYAELRPKVYFMS